MIWSILPLVAIVIAFVAFCQPRVDREDNLTSAGLEEFRRAERVAGVSLPRPRELGGGWSVSDSVLDEHGGRSVTLTMSYRTPNGATARLVESTRSERATLAAYASDVSAVGDLSVDDRSWRRWRVGADEALTARFGSVTVVLGGSAQLGELRMLAAAMR